MDLDSVSDVSEVGEVEKLNSGIQATTVSGFQWRLAGALILIGTQNLELSHNFLPLFWLVIEHHIVRFMPFQIRSIFEVIARSTAVDCIQF